jgi:hypothetical protein
MVDRHGILTNLLVVTILLGLRSPRECGTTNSLTRPYMRELERG